MGFFSDRYKKEVLDFIASKFDDIENIDCMRYGSYGESASDEVVNENMDNLAYQTDARWCRNGISKCVFYFDEYPDIVIKVPFEGCVKCHYDIDIPHVVEDDSKRLFKNANGKENSSDIDRLCWDYCYAEAKNYELAESLGIQNVFAATEFIGIYNRGGLDIYVYISEYIGAENEYYKNTSDGTMQMATDILNRYDYSDMSCNILWWLIDTYGQAKADMIIKFLSCNDINDLHSYNWRIDKDGNRRIIDYSSFND